MKKIEGWSYPTPLQQGCQRVHCEQRVARVASFRERFGNDDTQVRESLRVLAVLLFALYTHKEGVTVDEDKSSPSFNFVFLRIYSHHAHRFSHAIREVVQACIDNVLVFPERFDDKLRQECRLPSRWISHDQYDRGCRIAFGKEFVDYSYSC